MGVSVSSDLTVMERLSRSSHLLRARELAEILDLSVPAIFKQAREGRLPCIRVGGYSVRFDGAAVAKALCHIGN